MNIDERLKEMFKGVGWDGSQEIKQLIKECIEYVKPEREELSTTIPHLAAAQGGHNAAIRDMEAKIKEIGL